MKILLACDSFKGCMTSTAASEAARRGVLDSVPEAETLVMPVADGGEGTMEAISRCIGAERVCCMAHDPLMRPIGAEYAIGVVGGVATAVIDMASASGLTLLSASERNPAVATTYGTGEMIADAWARGARRFVVGIGGSATVDAGKGMLEALGVRFIAADGTCLAPGGASLADLECIDLSAVHADILAAPFTIVCDVDNPLCGPAGAACVYAPQKGADASLVERLDQGLRRFAEVVHRHLDKGVASQPGAGAAGGMGAAFAAFFNAQLRSGIDIVLDLAGYDQAVAEADLVITGEGRSDAQTLRGKVPFGILRRSGKVPVVILSGTVDDALALSQAGFAAALSIQQGPISLAEAMDADTAVRNMRATAAQVVRLLVSKKV